MKNKKQPNIVLRSQERSKIRELKNFFQQIDCKSTNSNVPITFRDCNQINNQRDQF